MVTGETWQKYESSLSYKNRVDFKLLENIKDAREILISDYKLDDSVANALLGKSIFIRYLIDRHVRIGFDSEDPREWSNDDFCKILSSKKITLEFFRYLDKKFNGDLFPFTDSYGFKVNPESLGVIINLLKGVEIKSGQLSLFDIYDFSIIPIEFISNVYELFIGQREQADMGVYYTPLFLVDYIISQTLRIKLSKNSNKEYKILDPACGSGIFLVESLRLLIQNYIDNNPTVDQSSQEYRDKLRNILEVNIFGIDKDLNAIKVAIFSIYITLLDYQQPRDIENFIFPKLLDKNFFVADFFDLDHFFNKCLNTINFDFIVGNPPWKRGSKKNVLQQYQEYIRGRRRLEKDFKIKIQISNKEIAQAFLLRTSDFSNVNTEIALIVTSKILYNLNAFSFRKYFLEYYIIDRILELSPVRREVFNKSNDPSIAPPAIIFYRFSFGSDSKNNMLQYYSLKPNKFFSLFNIFILQRHDIKSVNQELLKKHDWLWKTLLYGNFLDYNFLQRLLQYSTINDRIKNKGYLTGQGFQIGTDVNPVGKLKKLNLLPTNNVRPFRIDYTLRNFNMDFLHRVRNKELYYGNRLLVKKGLNNELKAVAAICHKDCLFKDSLTAIKTDDNIEDLRIISGLLQSNLFSFYALHKFSSIGVEREQGFNEEKFSFPYIENIRIAKIVERIENSFADTLFREVEDPKLIKILNDIVEESFNLSEIEKALIEYSLDFVVPNITKRKSVKNNKTRLGVSSKYLIDYSNVFLSKFSSVFGKMRIYNIEVWHSKYIVGMIFKIVPPSNNLKNSFEIKYVDNKNLLELIISLGHKKITDNLFIQKDIRGFEKDSLYIFKPNDERLWHKAIAYYDLNEFTDSILKAGRNYGSV